MKKKKTEAEPKTALDKRNKRSPKKVEPNPSVDVSGGKNIFLHIFQSSPMPTALIDISTNQYLDVNSAFLELTEYTLDEVIGKTPSELNLFVQTELYKELGRQLKIKGAVRNVKLPIRSKTGKILYGLFTGEIISFEGIKYFLTIMIDITEQIQTERELRISEERLRASLSASKQGIYDVDLITGDVIINPEYAEMLGSDPALFTETVEGWEQRLHPDDHDRAAKNFRDYLQGKSDEYNQEFRLKKQDGSWVWVQSIGKILEYDAEGKPTRILGTHTDISAQKETQFKLQRRAAQMSMLNDVGQQIAGMLDIQGLFDLSARLLHEAFGFHHVGIFTLDKDRNVLNLQAHFGKYSNLFPSDHYIEMGKGMVGAAATNGQMLLSNDVEKDSHYKKFISRLATRSELALPIQFSGKVVGVLDVQSPEANAFSEDDIRVLETLAGQIAVAIENAHLYESVQLELRERQQAEDKSLMLTVALESAVNGVVITDKAGVIQWVNKAWVEMTGYSAEEAVGRKSNIVSSGFHDPNFYKKLWGAILAGKTWHGEFINRRRDGSLFTEDTSINPVFDRNGEIINYIGIKQDITARKDDEKVRRHLIHDLGERVKELTALHQVARLLQTPNLSEMEAMQGVINLLPPAMQYPEIAKARISTRSSSFSTEGFKETPWSIEKSFTLPSGEFCKIEIVYLEERPKEAVGPFLQEETDLLGTFAERLQSALVRHSMENNLRQRAERLSTLVKAGNALSETLQPEHIYPIINRYIGSSIPCDFLIVSSFDRLTETITCKYLHSSEGSQDVSHFPPIPLEPPGQGTQSRVIRSGEPLLLSDYQSALKTANTNLYFNETAEIVDAPTYEEEEDIPRSAIIVPLKTHGVTVGALQVLSSKLNAYTDEDFQFVEALAFHVSAALSNAALVASLEDRVRQRTAEVQDLYDKAPIGYHSLDENGRIITVNQTHSDWLGYAREELIGQHVTNFLTPQSHEKFKVSFTAFLENGRINNSEMDFIRKDGSILPALVNAVAITDQHGNYLMSRSTIMDNSERKKAEMALKQSEETYRALFESANDAILIIGLDHTIMNANANCSRILGYSIQELVGKKTSELLPPDELGDSLEKTNRLLRGESLPIYERRLIRQDGGVVETEINLSLVRDEEGYPKFIQSVIREITARKQAENALRESEEQNRLLFEEAPDAMVLFNRSGRVVQINHAVEAISGISGSKIIGNMITKLGILPQDLVKALSDTKVDPFENKGKFAQLDFQLSPDDGEKRHINARIYALNLHGEPHYLASMHDVTLRKRAEEAMQIANAEMQRALNLKDEFLANMSHELRTPLNAILGITESLLEQISGPLNEKQQKYLQTVLESAQHLLELINDILDLAKINAGRIDLEITEITLNTVAQSSLRMIRQLALKKQLTVNLEIEENTRLIQADERRLKQMLVNLLGNAVKFTKDGGQIGLHIIGDTENKTVKFIVWDTGIGISTEDIPRLFQPFMQLDAGLSRGNQGTGLGLTLVNQMALLHGGNVSVESELEKGSRFTITLPMYSDKFEEYRSKTEKQLPPHTTAKLQTEASLILLVEDTEVIASLLCDYLKIHGYRVITAQNGLEGVEAAKTEKPDLILMDVMMPEMDGYEATRRIRLLPALVNVPIIALTALAMPLDREKCLAAGMTDYSSKPIKLKELLNLIESYLHRETKNEK
ncbi:MAG: PAS domain S-box protein [Anaerolineales bacterium]|nr:PAS domain S-box protein [Anaerolineales bacterium]